MSQSQKFAKVYLDPDNQLFSGVMSNRKRYIIPRFQRDYSWESEHWVELWEDIEQMRENKAQHFMGYLVFQTHDGKTFQVIDGQQRLITLSIVILTAIKKLKELVAAGNEPDANEQRIKIYQDAYIGVSDPVTLRTEPKLVLNRHNDAHFRSLVKNTATTRQRNLISTNRQLDRAFRFFDSRFQSCQSGEAVAAILGDIEDGLLFTTITVQDDLNAYTVFETLNARGLRLSTPDLLKNYLLSVLANDPAYSEGHFVDFEEQWAGIIEQLGEFEFTNFLRSHRGMKERLVNKRDLFRVLKKDVNAPARVLPYLEDVKKHAAVYAALQDHNDKFWLEEGGEYGQARQHLEVLNLFGIKTPLSLMMAGFEKLLWGGVIKLLQQLAVVSIRYNVICNKSAKDQESLYNDMANELMGEYLKHGNLTDSLQTVYPDDASFSAAFAAKTMPSARNSKKILFLLRKIEQQLRGDEPPPTLTLEHVLPASPDDAWQECFGRNNYEDGINRLGNIALLPSKQNLGQEDFATKREILGDSPYKINQHIAEYEEWNMDNLQDHQKWLAKQAKTVWKITQLQKYPSEWRNNAE